MKNCQTFLAFFFFFAASSYECERARLGKAERDRSRAL